MHNENLYKKNCIRTRSGKYFNFLEPREEDIEIEDIAHALSMLPRFGGHLAQYYSVAQHSVECYYLADPEDQLQALMHDASEAYLLDIPSPVKQHLRDYKYAEQKIMKLIAKKYKFQWPLRDNVKKIDTFMLEREWNHLMIQDHEHPGIQPWDQKLAKAKFLEAWHRCNNKIN